MKGEEEEETEWGKEEPVLRGKKAADGDALEDVKDGILGCLAKEAHKADQFQGLITGPG